MNLNHPLLTIEQEQSLIARIKAGDTLAQEILLEHNEKLVYKIAMRFVRTSAPDVQIYDLMQAGRIGLLHAVEKWDHKIAKQRNVRKFSTYASWWVYQYIRRVACRHRSGLSRSVELDDLSYAVQRIRGELLKKLKREPIPKEIARASKIPLHKIQSILNAPEIVRLDNLSRTENAYHESIPDPSVNVEGDSEASAMVDGYMTVLENAFPRHARIVRMLFGLNETGRVYKLEEVARREGVTRQRIQQIKDDALEHLRSLNNLG